jgi:hypothetical protein
LQLLISDVFRNGFLTRTDLNPSYSSVLYRSITSYDYLTVSVAESTWLTLTAESASKQERPNITDLIERKNRFETHEYTAEKIIHLANSTLEKMSPPNCMLAYGRVVQPSRGDLIILVGESGLNRNRSTSVHRYSTSERLRHPYLGINETVQYGRPFCPLACFTGMCNEIERTREPGQGHRPLHSCEEDSSLYRSDNRDLDTCLKVVPQIRASEIPWLPSSGPVEYCLSKQAQELCQLRFNNHLAWIVCFINILKLVILISVFLYSKEDPLLTIGDAIKSFLISPDITTKSFGLVSKFELQSWISGFPDTSFRYLQTYEGRRARWFHSAGASRSIATLFP